MRWSSFAANRPHQRRRYATRSTSRPCLEQLENRLAPATWDGGGLDNNWMTPANWVGDVATAPGASLVFPAGAAQTTNVNNFPGGTAFKGITITGDYNIQGNGITLSTGIAKTTGGGAAYVFLPITLTAEQAFTSSSGYLALLGSINNNGFLLRANTDYAAAIYFFPASTIGGTGGLWKTGPGALQIYSATSYSGGTTLSEGELVISNNGALGTGPVKLQTATITAYGADRTLANPVILSGTSTLGSVSYPYGLTFTGVVTLTANRTINVVNPVTFSGSIGENGGSFKLSKTGSGTLTLSGNNTYSGGTALQGTTGYSPLVLGNNNALGTGPLILLPGSQVQADGAARTIANPVHLDGDAVFAGTLDMTFTGPVTLSASRVVAVSNGLTAFEGSVGQSLSGSTLIKTGGGTLVLSGNNTFSGGVRIVDGTLGVGNDNALGTGTVTLQTASIRAELFAHTVANPVFFSGTSTIAGANTLIFTGPATLTANRTLNVTNSAFTVFSGVIGDGGGSFKLSKTGGGTLVLSGSNTFSGGLNSGAGILALGNNNAAGAGPITLYGGAIRSNGIPRTIGNAIYLSGDVGITGMLDITFTGQVTLTGTRSLDVTNTALSTFSGPIGESGGSFKLGKTGPGTLVLSGANTFSGGFTMNAGTLAIGNNSALGSGLVTLWGSSTLRAEGGARTVANSMEIPGTITFGGTNPLTLSGAMVLTNGTRTFTFINTALTTFSGPVSGAGFIKYGPRALRLTGNNTYPTTAIYEGAVQIDGSQPGNEVIVNPGGTLMGVGTVGVVTVHDGGLLNPGDSPGILHTGGIQFVASPYFVVEIQGAVAGSGYDQLQVTGSVNLGASSNLDVILAFTPSVGTSLTIIDNDGVDAVSGTFAGLAEGATLVVNGLTFQITYQGGTGNDVVLSRIA